MLEIKTLGNGNPLDCRLDLLLHCFGSGSSGLRTARAKPQVNIGFRIWEPQRSARKLAHLKAMQIRYLETPISSSFLGNVVPSLKGKRVISKKELHRSLQVDACNHNRSSPKLGAQPCESMLKLSTRRGAWTAGSGVRSGLGGVFY